MNSQLKHVVNLVNLISTGVIFFTKRKVKEELLQHVSMFPLGNKLLGKEDQQKIFNFISFLSILYSLLLG